MRASPALLSLAPLILAACSDDSLKVRNTPPNVAFMAPADGSTVAPDTELALIAEVGDAESPLEELTLSWQRSDGVTLLGEQRSTDTSVSLTLTAGLPEGTYTVTLIVADPQAESDEDTVTFDVRPLPPDTGDTGGGDTADTGDTGDTGADTADTGYETGEPGDTGGDTGITIPDADVVTTGCEGTDVDSALWTVIPEGPIFEDTVLDLARSPYCVAGTVSMAAGTTLTIEAGVRVLGAQRRQTVVRWDGSGGTLVAEGDPAAPILLQRLSFGTTAGSDAPETATVADVHVTGTHVYASQVSADAVTTTWHAPWAADSASWLVGLPALDVTNSLAYGGGYAGVDIDVADTTLELMLVNLYGTLRMTRVDAADTELYLRADGLASGNAIVLDAVTFLGGSLASYYPTLYTDRPFAWQVTDSVFVDVAWRDAYDGSPERDADPVELPLSPTFARNVFVRNRGWFRLTGDGSSFTNNAFADPQLSEEVTRPEQAIVSIATDATATVTRNSFLGFDDSLGDLALGLDTTHGDATTQATYGALLDATENDYGTSDAATVQRLLHDRTDDTAFGHYIRPNPVLSARHADTPDPAPWR